MDPQLKQLLHEGFFYFARLDTRLISEDEFLTQL